MFETYLLLLKDELSQDQLVWIAVQACIVESEPKYNMTRKRLMEMYQLSLSDDAGEVEQVFNLQWQTVKACLDNDEVAIIDNKQKIEEILNKSDLLENLRIFNSPCIDISGDKHRRNIFEDINEFVLYEDHHCMRLMEYSIKVQ